MSLFSAHRWVLGVDGGGTKTVARLASVSLETTPSSTPAEVTFFPVGMAGPANPHRVGWETAQRNLQEAVELALRQVESSEVSSVSIERACIAVAGLGTQPDRMRMREWARQFGWGECVSMMDDGQIILQAIESEAIPLAVVLISGTGSLAMGADKSGRTMRSGGWGEQWGDTGSGLWLAIAALQRVTRWCDGRESCGTFARAVLRHLDLKDAAAFRVWLRHVDVSGPSLRELAPFIRSLADSGDQVALQLRQEAAASLATLVTSVLRQFGFPSSESGTQFQLALAGGWLTSDLQLQEQVLRLLADQVGQPVEAHRIEQPVNCAVRCAIRQLTSSRRDQV